MSTRMAKVSSGVSASLVGCCIACSVQSVVLAVRAGRASHQVAMLPPLHVGAHPHPSLPPPRCNNGMLAEAEQAPGAAGEEAEDEYED